MKELYKLEENKLVIAPTRIVINGNAITHPTDAMLISVGYKYLIIGDKINCNWYERVNIIYSEDSKYIYKNFEPIIHPNIKSLYVNNCLVELNRALENDFTWPLIDGHVVKLSQENQSDYVACENRLLNNPELLPYINYTFKDKSIKYYMSNIDEVKDFGKNAFLFVANQLSLYREKVLFCESLTNEDLYNFIKK